MTKTRHFLATGESDPWGDAYPSTSILDRLTGYKAHLKNSLLKEVARREKGRQLPSPPDLDLPSFARNKLTPMVRGLFPGSEQEIVLGVLENSVVFLTPESIGRVIKEARYLHTAWMAANIYLASLGAKTLSGKGSFALGMCVETTCYVSMEYFAVDRPFEDYVVHEAAHVFHNNKRKTIGLPHTRYKEWMLPIDFCKRETFAWACEVYSRILEQSRGPAQRKEFLAEFGKGSKPSTEQVNPDELMEILSEAVEARNGWKRILARCSRPVRRRKRE